MVEYQRGSHTLHDIKYHLVWITKYRYHVLRGAVAGCDSGDLHGSRSADHPRVSGADHVHMLVASPPKLAPAKLVQSIKGRSSRKLQQEFSELRRRYWGQHLWARGYFCATVGAVDEETIKEYIESQRWEDDGGEAFKVTPPPSP